MSLSRSLQYAFIAIIVTTVGFSLYQWNASRASTQKTASNNGLVGYWSFNEGTGTQAGDASGNGNTGTLTNGPTWTTGKLGQALDFDGTDDYTTTLDADTLDVIDSTNFTLTGWFNRDTFTTDDTIIGKSNGQASSDTGYNIYIDDSTDKLTFVANDGTDQYKKESVSTFTATGWHHFVLSWDDSSSANTKLYIDGLSEATTDTGTFANVNSLANALTFRLGAESDNGNPFDGKIDEVRMYNRALSGTEITNLYNLGAEKLNVSPTPSSTSGLVGYWTFDGKDTLWSSSSAGTATDRSGNSNTGTLTNMSQSTSPTIGKLGQALDFDGSTNYVTVNDANSLDLTNTLTLSAWIKRETVGACGPYKTVVSKGDNNAAQSNYDLITLSGCAGADNIAFGYYNSGSHYIRGNTPLSANIWYHLVAVYDDAADKINLYVNGVLQINTVLVGSPETNSLITNIRSLTIARRLPSIQDFNGAIDEVRVYNRALSATEVQSLYDLGASDKVNSSVSQNQGTGRLDSGIAGYWKLDENTGTTTTDASTNAATGTLTNGPTWTTGQIGSAVDFDGSDDFITAPDADAIDVIDATNFTVTGWFNRDTFTTDDTIVAKSNGQAAADTGYNIYIDDTTDKVTVVSNDGTDQYKKQSVSTFTATGWHHFALSWNDSSSANTKLYIDGVSEATTNTGTFANVNSLANALAFRIGAESDAGNPFDGKLDEIRIYSRVLSDDEVSQLYRLTAPTGVDTSLKGYWSFDGSATNWTSSSAGTVSDLSGSGNTGTMTNMSQSTSVIRGQLGQALNFDGVNQYVSMSGVPVTSFPFTTIVWFKTTNATGSYRTISSLYGNANSAIAIIQFDSGSGCANSSRVKYTARDNSASASASICSLSNVNDGTWHQAVGVSASASDHQLYIDGVSQGTSSTALGTTTFNTMRVGSYIGQYFPGSTDEVRIYNRALSSTEISALYNSAR